MRRAVLAGLLLACGPLPVAAIYIRGDVVDVPVERIIKNLEALVLKDADDVSARHALARAHAIAYAQDGTSVSVELARPYGRPGQPLDERQLADDDSPPELGAQKPASAEARAHLAESLKHYREAAELAPADPAIALGLGWTLQQSGEDRDARDQYERALRRATAKQYYELAREAGSYLLSLLSPISQLREREALQKRLADLDERIEARGRAVTPILVPLVENASFEDLVARDAAVSFDLDGSGLPRRWQWITPRAGWLVYRGGGERRVDSGLRILGSRTFWILWSNGYDALAALDDDGDGWLSGAELAGLAIWRDADSDGVAAAAELLSLGEWGVVTLSCAHVTHTEGFPYSPSGVVFADGSVRPSYDWIARSAPSAPASGR
jgi:tetratricopeptide (TPR) repeat protein